ncbi:hypothetical protein [Streptomyces fradiae]|uniref:hypothetical protein n=1 Tax=Streptomyces fradiae TaxID=1906 RepID=UPI0036F5993A
MSTTGTTLRTACHLLNYYGLADPNHPHYAMPDGRLTALAALYRAATGTTPPPVHDDPDTAKQLMLAHPLVHDSIRWISAVLPTQPGLDEDTNLPDHIDHIDHWAADTDPYTGHQPNTSDVIGLLLRAAHAADTLTHTTAPRHAA